MKMNFHRLVITFSLLFIGTLFYAQIPDDCESVRLNNGWPEHYCECKYEYQDFVLPLDTIVNESIWLKGWLSDLSQGISAYLHSDCDLSFDVYTTCSAAAPKYSAIFTRNKANTIDGNTIKQKLEENGLAGTNIAFYICISPVGGQGGRLIMQYDTDIMASTCEDPLYLFPGMSLYSKQNTDVYVIDPNQISNLTDIILSWEGQDQVPCQLTITDSSCEGTVLEQVSMQSDEDVYVISKETLKTARNNNKTYYLHFSHANNTIGQVHCLEPVYEENYIDTFACQGVGVQVHDTILLEPTIYTIDTVHMYSNQYMINIYKVVIIIHKCYNICIRKGG